MATNTSHRPADDINRRIVDSSEDCLKVLDLEGRVTYINGAGVRHLGLHSPADLLGRTWLDSWQGEARQAAQEALARARAGGRGTFQGLHTTADGISKWWEVVATPITDTNGAVVQLLVVSRDLTDRLREEAFYAGQHHVLEMIASGAALEVILSSLAHLFERQSDNLRCSVVLLEGNRLRHGAAPSLPAAYVRVIDGLTIGPRAGSCGTAMYLAQQVIVTDIFDDPLWADYCEVARPFGFRACWSEPILSSQRTVLGSFAIYADEPRAPTREELHLMNIAAHLAGVAIEQRQALRALHHSEERNRAMLRAIPDWMFVTSADGTFLDYHAKDPEKLLAPPSVFMGKSIPDILPPPVANALIRASALALEFDQPEHLEYALGAEDQQRFYEATVVRCGSDKVLSIVRDITDRKQSEMDASAQHRELAHLGRVAMLGELSGALAHELSQPLAAILSNAQAAQRLLDRSPLDLTEVRAALEDIVSNDKRAGAVINRLRALLKKDASVLQPVNLNEVTREVLDLAHSDLLLRRVAVTTRFEPLMPAVLGDRIQLQQVILNLVLNACDAMAGVTPADRHLTIETHVLDGVVQVSVSDCGTGLPASQLDAVFQPFVTFKEGGLGLGLTISRSIVIAHRGHIIAENNEHCGATFRCSFPIASE